MFTHNRLSHFPSGPLSPPAPPRRLGLLSGSFMSLTLSGGSDTELVSPVITAPLTAGAPSFESFTAGARQSEDKSELPAERLQQTCHLGAMPLLLPQSKNKQGFSPTSYPVQ